MTRQGPTMRRAMTRALGFLAIVPLAISCVRPVIATRPDTTDATPSAPLRELWREPTDIRGRNLFWGQSRASQAPSATVEYAVTKIDDTGFSRGYDVVGPDGREWDIKVGPEAQTEVVMSRILWALGYHQPATYYLTRWRLAGTLEDEGAPARFRMESGHKTDGEWSWLDNPFTSARPYRGLIAINLILSNWDFKTSNNRVYALPRSAGAPRRRFVVQDLGASLGKPRTFPRLVGTRNDIDDFESTTLIADVRGQEVRLNYRGRHGDVLDTMHVEDVVWACELMNRLSDPQLNDAFRAAGYDASTRARYVTKVRAKLREGLGLRSVVQTSRGRQ